MSDMVDDGTEKRKERRDRRDRHMDFDTLSSKTTGTKLDRTSEGIMNNMLKSSPAEFPDKSTWIRKATQFFVRAYLEVEQVTDLQELLVDKVMRGTPGNPPPMFVVPVDKLDAGVKAKLMAEINDLEYQRDHIIMTGTPVLGGEDVLERVKEIPKPGFKQTGLPTNRPPPRPPDKEPVAYEFEDEEE